MRIEPHTATTAGVKRQPTKTLDSIAQFIIFVRELVHWKIERATRITHHHQYGMPDNCGGLQ
jgi:hypothetical protein